VDTAADRKLALRATEESMVLLKEPGRIATFNFAGKRVAVVVLRAICWKRFEANLPRNSAQSEDHLRGLRDGLKPGANLAYAQGSALAAGWRFP